MVSKEELEEIKKDLEAAEVIYAEVKADLERARRAGLRDIVEELEPQLLELEKKINALKTFVRGA